MRKSYLYLALIISFGLSAYYAHLLPYFPGDIEISRLLQKIDLPLFDPAMRAASYISSFLPALIIVATLAGVLLIRGKRNEPALIGLTTGLAALINPHLKSLIDRPRPVSELVQVMAATETKSFPSGHVLHAVVFYGMLFYLSSTLAKNPAAAKLLRFILILLILLTMLSRIYLGVHWFSDVVGGLLFGGLILATAITLYRSYAGRGHRKAGKKSARAS